MSKEKVVAIIQKAALVALGTFALFVAVMVISIGFKRSTAIGDISVDFKPDTSEVVVYNVYRDGHTKVIARFNKSSNPKVNPLLSALYAGNAPLSTSYDPTGMYESGAVFGSFEYNRGIRYNECGTFSRDEKTGIMTVKFQNGTISWVGPDGVIASAVVDYGYDFDDTNVYVAFYNE